MATWLKIPVLGGAGDIWDFNKAEVSCRLYPPYEQSNAPAIKVRHCDIRGGVLLSGVPPGAMLKWMIVRQFDMQLELIDMQIERTDGLTDMQIKVIDMQTELIDMYIEMIDMWIELVDCGLN